MGRTARVHRVTQETEITVCINLDGSGDSNISTGIGFFDHMLNGFAKHGFFDLQVEADGDLEVDTHHTVEDTGIVLGTALKESLGDKAGITRYGSCLLPMDEALVLCAVDLCGRPYLNWDADLKAQRLGDFETETVKEFFYATTYSAMMNLHLKVLDTGNTHHVIEAMFKAFARALDAATRMDDRLDGVLSTKGSI